MASIYLIRHGQASFGADNYDKLSELGWQQSRVLGAHLEELGIRFDAVITGTLQRQIDTWNGMAEGANWQGHTPSRHAGLNEYDSHAILQAYLTEPLPKPSTPELRRMHFQKLREGLKAWSLGECNPPTMPTYKDWVANMQDALGQAEALATGDKRIAVVSSGGPITTLLGGLTGMPPEASIELNLRIKNTAISELVVSKRTSVLSFNETPHLQKPHTAQMLTYA